MEEQQKNKEEQAKVLETNEINKSSAENTKVSEEKISEENLKVMDPSLFTDPSGINLGREGSSYSYEAANCSNGKCKEYTLKAQMEKEDTYIKKNRS